MSDRITVIHAPRDADHKYFALSRAVPQHSKLSFEARGVLCYLLSKPDDWVVRVQDLQREGDCGRDRIYRILKELKAEGYLHRDRVHKPDGTFEWGPYRVYEIPYTDNQEMEEAHQKATQPFTEKPYTEKPDTGKPYTENPHIYRRESKTDKRSSTPSSSSGGGDGRHVVYLLDHNMGAASEFADLDPDTAIRDFDNRMKAGQSPGHIVKAWRVQRPTPDSYFGKPKAQNGTAPAPKGEALSSSQLAARVKERRS